MSLSRRPTKDTWTGHLPSWRQGAIGRWALGTVFVVVTIDRDPGRHVRVEIPADHARSLAADLLAAADRADAPEGPDWSNQPDAIRHAQATARLA